MATEELPPYPQMILEAIESLKIDKSSISKYMETKYGEMPQGHSDQLTTHLAKMTASGELLFVNNNYLRRIPEPPTAKRGRGRPPKAKEPLPPGITPRSRGRPRKDTNAPKKPKPSDGGYSYQLATHPAKMTASGELLFANNNDLRRISEPAPAKRGPGRPPKGKGPLTPGAGLLAPRPRGRPRKDPNAPPAPKKPKPSSGGHSDQLATHLAKMTGTGEHVFVNNYFGRISEPAPAKRGRGRPPKAKKPLSPGAELLVPRPRGRPRKDPNAPSVLKTGRPRGRPRKVRPQPVQNAAVEA